MFLDYSFDYNAHCFPQRVGILPGIYKIPHNCTFKIVGNDIFIMENVPYQVGDIVVSYWGVVPNEDDYHKVMGVVSNLIPFKDNNLFLEIKNCISLNGEENHRKKLEEDGHKAIVKRYYTRLANYNDCWLYYFAQSSGEEYNEEAFRMMVQNPLNMQCDNVPYPFDAINELFKRNYNKLYETNQSIL